MKKNIYQKNIEGINHCSNLADLVYGDVVEKKRKGGDLFSGEERQLKEYTEIKKKCRDAAFDNIFAALAAYTQQ